MKHSFTFECSKCSSSHPAQVIYHDSMPCSLECHKTGEKFELPPGSEVWGFGDNNQIVNSFTEQLKSCTALWYLIGVQLDLSVDELDGIDIIIPDIPTKFKVMLSTWFNKPPMTEPQYTIITHNQRKCEELKVALSSASVGLKVAASQLHLP